MFSRGNDSETRPGGRRILLGDNTGDGAVMLRSYEIPVCWSLYLNFKHPFVYVYLCSWQ